MYQHTPVLLKEVIDGLRPQSGQHFIDGTVGGGGHASAILQASAPDGKLSGFDRDAEALRAAKVNLQSYESRVTLIHDSYANLLAHQGEIAKPVFGVLLDLGLSSAQLADQTRGFSFQNNGPLDLRFDSSAGISAAELVNTADEAELVRIFKQYGEEPQAKRIARAIIIERQVHPFATVQDLLEIIVSVKGRGGRSFHPATLVWQALRVAVNDEFTHIVKGLEAALKILTSGGTLAVISFHSGEDRVVKDFFRREAKDCLCPPEYPVCRCGHKAQLYIVTKKPIVASETELNINIRARSAKLRLARKK